MIGTLGIIGGGSWSTAIAKMLTDNGHTVNWWMRDTTAADLLNRSGHNARYLPSVHFKKGSVKATTSLDKVLDECHTLVIGVPSAYAEDMLMSVPAKCWQMKNIVSAIKGILPESGELLNDHLTDYLGTDLRKYVAITGPCHAEEVAEERLSYLTFSGLDDRLTGAVAKTFRNSYIHTTFNHDIWGAQFAAVLKNIYAIGAGMSRALDYGDNFLSVYITNCYREMYFFLKEHFNKIHPSTERPDFHTSAYLGDLLVTCYSLHSRNRTLGTMLGKGYTVKAAILEMNMVAEGYYASRGMKKIAQELSINMPIADKVHEVLWEAKPPRVAIKEMEDMLS